jgi:predicted dehydrogenase
MSLASNEQIRVAIVGTGFFSQFHYAAWARLPVNLVGCCSLEEAQAKEVAARYAIPQTFTNFEKMLDETCPDLVDIITPPQTHFDFVSAASARGIPVICQKPFCGSLDQADKLVKALDRAGSLCVVHENFRFQPWYVELKSLIGSGAIGDPYQVTFRLRPGDGQGPEAYLDRQPYFQKMPRFLVHETAIHWVDVFRFMMGDAASVTARLTKLNPAISGEDAGYVLFDFKNGARGLFDGNRLADHAAENRRLTMGEMLIEGSGGTLELNGDGEIFHRAFGQNASVPHNYAWSNEGFGGDCVYRLQAHVVDHLINDAPVQNSAAGYLANLRIEEAIYRSSREQRTINL